MKDFWVFWEVCNMKILRIVIVCVLIISCGSTKLSNNESVLLFSSVYDNDSCDLKINNKIYFAKEIINTDRSLGIDLKKRILVTDDTLKISISFTGIVVKKLSTKRTVNLDTLLYSKNGSFILIRARGKNIVIEQQSTPFVLD
jgi:hypothetical protein